MTNMILDEQTVSAAQAHLIHPRVGVRSTPSMSDGTFRTLSGFIYEKLGIFFAEKKKYLLEGRLGKRLQLLGLGDFDAYVQLLKYGPQREEEFAFLCTAVTINETFFFRNAPHLEAFERTLVPEFLQTGRGRTLRIWSAASSSGEEAFSLALLYLERLRPVYPDLRIEIVASDVSRSVLDMARKGVYNRYAVRNLPEEYLRKYFTVEGERYCLRQEVKELVRFQHLNLVDRDQMKTMKNFDVIYCCNVLIYFDLKAKVQVVSDLYNNLNYRGYLFIGFSEMLHGISSAFKVVSFPQTTGYRKD